MVDQPPADPVGTPARPDGIPARPDSTPTGPGKDPAGAVPLPEWWEDPDLALAVAEVDSFAGDAGWDRPPQLFALVPTDLLRRQQPDLAAHLADNGAFTPIAQDALPAGDLQAALAGIIWPASVAGCALVREIVVLPPDAAAAVSEGGADTENIGDDDVAARAAAHPERTEARLVAGVLREGAGGACLLRVRPRGGAVPVEPLRGGDLAPGLLEALRATFS